MSTRLNLFYRLLPTPLAVSFAVLFGWTYSPQPTLAVHTSGSSYTFIGFSMDGNVLVRLDDFQFGAKQFETFRLDEDQPRMIHAVPTRDEEAIERKEVALKKSFGIVSVGFPGAVAPNRSAAVVVLPQINRRPNRLSYNVEVVDSRGNRKIATIPVPTECTILGRPHARLRAFWSPANNAAILVGNVMLENPCDDPSMVPVLVVANVKGPAEAEMLVALASRLETQADTLSKNRVPEALAVNMQLMDLKPNSPSALLRLAKLRTQTQHTQRAISTLWHLRSINSDSALVLLRRIQQLEWTRPLRKSPGYMELLQSLPGKARTLTPPTQRP